MALETLKEILMRRDSLSDAEAQDLIDAARQAVAEGADPEEVLHDEFGLEPDYFWELI